MYHRRVRQLVRRGGLISTRPETPVLEACRLMAQRDIGALVVLSDGALSGIFTERDALKRVLAEDLDPEATEIGAVMTREVITLDPETGTLEALRLMSQIGARHLPIVENGEVLGIISLRDFMSAELQSAGGEG